MGPANYPIEPGHEIVAEVYLVGSEIKDFKKGNLVGFEQEEIAVKNAVIVKKIEKIYVQV